MKSDSDVETWLPIPSLPGYEASSAGRIRNVQTGTVRAIYAGAYHRTVQIKGKTRAVREMVCSAFHGPKPAPRDVVRHRNGDPHDDRAENLQWGSHADNMKDAVGHGAHYWAAKQTCPRGHRLVAPNLVPAQTKRGKRECLACQRGRANTRHAATKGVVLDLRTEADRHYRQLMEATG